MYAPLNMYRRLVAGVVILLAGLAGCSSEPTAQEFCEYFYGKGEEFRQPYLDANVEDDPLGGIALLLGAQGDLAAFFKGLADHSPDEIKADVEAVAMAFESSADRAGDSFSDPLGALGGNLLAGLGAMGPMSRVDTYVQDNCGAPPTG
jgi:hypothetical protein